MADRQGIPPPKLPAAERVRLPTRPVPHRPVATEAPTGHGESERNGWCSYERNCIEPRDKLPVVRIGPILDWPSQPKISGSPNRFPVRGLEGEIAAGCYTDPTNGSRRSGCAAVMNANAEIECALGICSISSDRSSRP
jgi:hypothetical protein